MAAARPVFSSAPRVSSPASGECSLIPDEALPLLKPRRTHAHRQTISERWRTAWSSFLDDNSGLLLVVASQFFFSAMGVAVKWLIGSDDPVPTLELILVRMVITYVCSVAYMYWKRIPDPFLGPKGLRALLVLRGLTGFFSLAGMYFSLQYLSLSDATVLTFIAPILTSFSGAVFLKEPLSFRETLSGLCSFLGVVLIARPQFLFGSQAFSDPSEELVTPAQRMISIAAALIGVLGATAMFTVLRVIGKRAHILQSLNFFASQCVLGSTLGMVLFKVPLVVPTRVLWLAMMFVVGILGLIGQALLTMGLQRETAGRSALAIYSSIVFAIMFEFIFSRTTPSPLSVIGTLIIVSSAMYITLTKKPVTKPDSAPKRPAPNHDDDLEV
ncbi:EamA-like transporter family-domain-containing protein [Lactarius hengduanensis]|nr:EamA-like transporter family-domain-containing protein [Lactarius hengduanensis]